MRSMQQFFRPPWVFSLVLVCAAAWGQERVQVTSLDQVQGQPVQMPGFWFAPPTTNATSPAMLLLHGCGGPYGASGQLSVRMQQYAARLQAMGIGALVTDSLTPRGEKELCTQRTGTRKVTQTQRRRDALGALQWLSQQPGVDSARLGLMGWSNGGSTVLASINRTHPEVAASLVRPSLAVAYYPGCESDLKRGYQSPVPLLLLVGERDDWTPAAPCIEMARSTSALKTELEVYPESYHGFDSSAPVRLRKDVPNGVNPGQGVHVGGNPLARSASEKRLEAFLRVQWKLAMPG